MQKVSVLRGSLNDISLLDLMQVISLGRQYMSVELQASGGDVLGKLLLKSGMLLDARTPQEHGKDAFFLLLGDPRAESFNVFRLLGSWQNPTPLGRIDSLVMELASVAPAQPVAPAARAAAPAPPVPGERAPSPGPRGRLIAISSPKGAWARRP